MARHPEAAPPPPRRRASRRAAATACVLAFVLATGCGRGGGADRPTSAPPLHIGGQRVLVLPVQAAVTLPVDRVALDAEILFAFAERDPRVVWIGPEELRQALRRAPGFAGDPGALPADPLLHHGERRAIEPLAGEVRRFAALTDARLVFLPRAAAAPEEEEGETALRIQGSLLDARSGNVVWWGEVQGRAAEGRGGLAALAGSLAQRFLAGAPLGANR